jgi:hypothetical protein
LAKPTHFAHEGREWHQSILLIHRSFGEIPEFGEQPIRQANLLISLNFVSDQILKDKRAQRKHRR